MGIRQKGLVFIILSFLFHVPASLSLSQTDFNSASVQENIFESKIINEESSMRKESTNAEYVNRGASSSASSHGGGSSSRRLGASGGRGGGGGSIGGGGGGGRGVYGGGGSSSRSPYTPGTSTVIPMQGAGAASRHRSWGSRCESRAGFSTILILLVVLLL